MIPQNRFHWQGLARLEVQPQVPLGQVVPMEQAVLVEQVVFVELLIGPP